MQISGAYGPLFETISLADSVETLVENKAQTPVPVKVLRTSSIAIIGAGAVGTSQVRLRDAAAPVRFAFSDINKVAVEAEARHGPRH